MSELSDDKATGSEQPVPFLVMVLKIVFALVRGIASASANVIVQRSPLAAPAARL